MRFVHATALFSTMLAGVQIPAAAATCSNKMHHLPTGTILAQSILFARPGEEDTLYRGTLAEAKIFKEHGLPSYTVYRGPGGAQAAVVWEIVFTGFKAHDAWLKAINTS